MARYTFLIEISTFIYGMVLDSSKQLEQHTRSIHRILLGSGQRRMGKPSQVNNYEEMS